MAIIYWVAACSALIAVLSLAACRPMKPDIIIVDADKRQIQTVRRDGSIVRVDELIRIFTCPTLKTRQVKCYAAGPEIPCAGTGQDGEVQRGSEPSYVDNSDGTITDTRTGLMWEKLSADGSIHDVRTQYTWAEAFATKVAALNSGSFAGYSDWRLPNVNELHSMVNYGAISATVDGVFNTGCPLNCTVTTCSCVEWASYWSSTTVEGNPQYAKIVNFHEGDVNSSGKALTIVHRVRAVRDAGLSLGH